MKVKISYTVDLEEVPHKVQRIVDEAIEEGIAKLESANAKFVEFLIEKGNIEESHKILTLLRDNLVKVDLQLSDCCELLSSLQSTRGELNKIGLGDDNEAG